MANDKISLFQNCRGLRSICIVSLSILVMCFASFGLTNLKVSSNKRYLVDQDNKPVLIHADTPWKMFSVLTEADALYHLNNRQAKKFNVVQVMMLPWGVDETNKSGQRPFTAKISGTNYWDMSKPNANYFAFCDKIINAAAARNMYVFISVSWTGFNGQNWYKTIIANGPTRCKAYGQWLGNRYKNFPNIVWIMMGDKNPDGGEKDEIRAMALGLQATDPNHLITAHCKRQNSALDWFSGESWLTLNNTYSNYEQVVAEALTDYKRTTVMPSYLSEGDYEGNPEMTPLTLRRQAYWALFSGLAGQAMGQWGGWDFDPDWKTMLNSTHSKEQVFIRNLMESRVWYMMAPDLNKSVVTNSGAAFPATISALRATDGRTVMVYLPGGQKPTVAMSKVSGGKAKCWWYNPRTGAATLISTYTATGTRTFTPPDMNDWVLVLDDATKNIAAPGQAGLAKEDAVGMDLATREVQAPALFQSLDGQLSEVTIYSASGRVVKSYNGTVTSIADMNALIGPGAARGMYYYTISNKKGVVMKGKLTPTK